MYCNEFKEFAITYYIYFIFYQLLVIVAWQYEIQLIESDMNYMSNYFIFI